MENLVKYIVENLVDEKDKVEVSTVEESEKVSVVTVNVAKEDIGAMVK